MTKRLLYIDSDAPAGHLKFNQIWLNALGKEPIRLSLALPKRMTDGLCLPQTVDTFVIPASLYSSPGGLKWHIFSIFRLFWLRFRTSFSHYDLVLFSSFNAFSFYIGSLFCRKQCYLVCHNNIQKACKKKAIMFFLRKIAAKHHLIVFDENTKEHLQYSLHFPHVSVIHHGHMPPIDKSTIDFNVPAWLTTLKRNKKIVFVPSYSSTSTQFLQQITTDVALNQYLSANDIVVVLRSKIAIDNPNFRVINQRLSDGEYASVFIQADIILLAYPVDFRYRTSAVLIEALVNNKACVVSDIDAFRHYKAVLSPRSFFSDLSGLIEAIKNSSCATSYAEAEVENLLAVDFTSLLAIDKDSKVD